MQSLRSARVLALAVVATMAIAARAALPIYEPFADAVSLGGTAYTIGDPVPGQNNGTNGAAWFAAGAAGTNNSVSAANLSVTGLSSSSGGSMQFGVSSGPSARLNLGSSFNSGILYYSFALKVTDLGTLGTSGGFIAGFNNTQNAQGSTPTVITTALMMRAVAGQPGNYNIGVRKGTGTPAWSPTALSVNNTVFVVGSYTFNPDTTTDDVAKMWVNPSFSTFGGATPADELVHNQAGQADIASIASLVFWRRGDSNGALQPAAMFADEVRLGSTWAEVTPQGAVPSTTGDFNNDGRVDAADYVVWRKANGTSNALPNDNGLGVPIGSSHYTLWRQNFGNPPGSGSGFDTTLAVPEPCALGLIAYLLLPFFVSRHRS